MSVLVVVEKNCRYALSKGLYVRAPSILVSKLFDFAASMFDPSCIVSWTIGTVLSTESLVGIGSVWWGDGAAPYRYLFLFTT